MVEPMVRELLADGADPAAVAKNGDTALKVARQYNCVACAELIATSLKDSRKPVGRAANDHWDSHSAGILVRTE